MELPFNDHVQEGECLNIRARDIRGNRSKPAFACGEAIRQYAYPLGDVPALDCAAVAASFADTPAQPDEASRSAPPPADASPAPTPTEVISTDSTDLRNGCALTAGAHAVTASWILLSGALAALARRRRVRPARSDERRSRWVERALIALMRRRARSLP